MAKVELTKEQELKVKKLMAQGRSKGEALVELGLYKKREFTPEETAKLTAAAKVKKPRAVDPDKQAIMDILKKALEDNDIALGDVTSREITFLLKGVSYTMSLVKHKSV